MSDNERNAWVHQHTMYVQHKAILQEASRRMHSCEDSAALGDTSMGEQCYVKAKDVQVGDHLGPAGTVVRTQRHGSRVRIELSVSTPTLRVLLCGAEDVVEIMPQTDPCPLAHTPPQRDQRPVRLPLPVNPAWDDEERQLAALAGRIAQEAVALNRQQEAQDVPLLERTVALRPVLQQWMEAITQLYEHWQHERDMECL